MNTSPPAFHVPKVPLEFLEDFAARAGMTCQLGQGAASCVHSEGCEGVTQEHLEAYTDLIARHVIRIMWDLFISVQAGVPPPQPPP